MEERTTLLDGIERLDAGMVVQKPGSEKASHATPYDETGVDILLVS